VLNWFGWFVSEGFSLSAKYGNADVVCSSCLPGSIVLRDIGVVRLFFFVGIFEIAVML